MDGCDCGECGDGGETKVKKGKAVVVGGSIAGLSCAHALTRAGWKVVVLEKSRSPPTGSPTGAGIGLDPFSRKIVDSWLGESDSLNNSTLPLTIDQNQATDCEKRISSILTRDEQFNFRAVHWSDLHSLLYNSLPKDIFLWSHRFVSFSISPDKTFVQVLTEIDESGEFIEIVGDLLVAADGCLSSIRKKFIPDLKLRYSGYCAWRGVLNFDTITDLKQAYPDLGKCLYFDLGHETHSVLYELPRKRLNWIWYINQPEPDLKGNSVTMKVSNEMIERMHEEAEKFWIPELVRIIQETKEPFLNVIYDCDPIEQLCWDDLVVLVGDAAHPTTPHGLRSTNMAINDATVLGKCIEKWGSVNNLKACLDEYQSTRLPVVSKQVLHSRQLGRVKQGLGGGLDMKMGSCDDFRELQQKNMPFFFGPT